MNYDRTGSEVQHIEDQRSADFGEASEQFNYDKSAAESFHNPLTPPPVREKTPKEKTPPPPKEKTPKPQKEKTPPPKMDENGHSDESSEGMVANHDPFKGIQEAIENQDDLRKEQADPFTPTSTD